MKTPVNNSLACTVHTVQHCQKTNKKKIRNRVGCRCSKKKIKNTQKVKQNALESEESRRNANFQKNPLVQATNSTKTNK